MRVRARRTPEQREICMTKKIWRPYYCVVTHHPTNPATSGMRLYDFQFDAKVVAPRIAIRRASEVVPDATAATTAGDDAIPAAAIAAA